MRALRLTHFAYDLSVAGLPDPVPDDDEVVVRVRAAGICHSDAHYRAGRGVVPHLPLTMGHEIAGVVVARGRDVTAPEVGARVAVHYLVSCGACNGCIRGEQFCVRGKMIGKDRDGGQAELVVVPARNAIAIPVHVSDEHAAIMMCSTATAYHSLQLAALQPSDSVAILGFGGLGVSALLLAKAMGVRRIVAIDQVEEKLAAARALGAETGGLDDIDVALDFAGSPALCTQALRSLNPGGRLMLVALNSRPVDFDPYRDVLAKERRIIGCSDHTREEVIDLLGMHLDLEPAITRRVGFEVGEVNAVLDDLDRGTPHFRSVIRFSDRA